MIIIIITGSRLNIPLSTTHCQVGSVVGCGLSEGKNKSTSRSKDSIELVKKDSWRDCLL